MRKKILSLVLVSTVVFANIPNRVVDNIENDSILKDNSNIYVRDQERAYKRIVSLGEKEGLSKEKID
ncbi:MAG: hypothetical protein ACRC92_12615, partial [Peptostreptococcaceae bacterium]